MGVRRSRAKRAGRYNDVNPMTAKEALDTANNAEPGERLRRYESICGPRDAWRREPLTNDPGRWTGCVDCHTLYDDYGKTVNRIPEIR